MNGAHIQCSGFRRFGKNGFGTFLGDGQAELTKAQLHLYDPPGGHDRWEMHPHKFTPPASEHEQMLILNLEGLDRLRVQRKACLKCAFSGAVFGSRRPMPAAAKPANRDHARPQVARVSASLRRPFSFRPGKGNAIDEDSRLLHGAPVVTNMCWYCTLGLWQIPAIIEPADTVFSPCLFIWSMWRSAGEVFTKEILEDLRTIFSDLCQDLEATLDEFDGERDPVDLLIIYPAKVTISHW